MIDLTSFEASVQIAIIGSSGGIGASLTDLMVAHPQVEHIYALSRQGNPHASTKVTSLTFDFTDEASIIKTVEDIKDSPKFEGRFDIIFVATGLLHTASIAPEKNLRTLSYEGFEQNFRVNTIGPAMTAKHFLPLLKRDSKAVFAALSARVGSISDNRLGGWYAYRAAKAALNMVIKTLAIEYARRFNKLVIIGLHPGTVDTNLSKPFQGNVPDGKLFTPEQSAEYLLKVINDVTPDATGHIIDWDGKIVPA
ncbi:MAG: SDR family NAD(P)-dependent oxidoreductase [Maricaulaceae bacterium]